MSTDIKAAAERVRRVRHNGEPIMVVYGSLTVETCGEAELEITHDVHRLADAYLAELDDTPIDEEWAAEICNELPEKSWLSKHPMSSHKGYWWLCLSCDGVVINSATDVKTRGHVRSLLRAMGVTHE